MAAQHYFGLRSFAAKQSCNFINTNGKKDLLEEFDRFPGGLEKAIGLRFEANMDLLPCVIANCRKVRDDDGKILRDQEFISVAFDPWLVRARNGAD
jgi:hypothetical protein